jgi:hypothetical protein
VDWPWADAFFAMGQKLASFFTKKIKTIGRGQKKLFFPLECIQIVAVCVASLF